MSNRTCSNCLFTESCPYNRPCRHFSPVIEDDEDMEVIIERARRQYKHEWRAYVEESDDSCF